MSELEENWIIGTFICVPEGTFFERKKYRYKYSKVSRAFHKESKPYSVERVPVEKLGFKKELTVELVFQREAVSTVTVQVVSAYFKQKIRIKIGSKRNLKHVYMMLIKQPKTSLNDERMLLVLRDFNANTCQTEQFGFRLARRLGISVRKIGKPQRISKRSLLELQESDTYIGQVSETNWDKSVHELRGR